MNGDVLLDTNIIIAFFGNDLAVVRQVQQARLLVPSIVLGELYAGARKSSRVEENLARIDALVTPGIVLSCDATTAHTYGLIKQALRMKGHPIPENDLWIAAIAVQHRLTLVTRDAHFRAVDGLSLEAW
jgi:tRNA(fMet)-specific endonuclease VapC